MKTLQTMIGGMNLASHYCATEAEIDYAIYDEIESFAISDKWHEVQEIRNTLGVLSSESVDPRFPSYDVDDAIMMWPGFRPF